MRALAQFCEGGLWSDDRDFQKSVQKIGSLVQELEAIADPAARSRRKELVQLLLDLHGAGLERMLDIVFQSGDPGRQVIDEFGQDSAGQLPARPLWTSSRGLANAR